MKRLISLASVAALVFVLCIPAGAVETRSTTQNLDLTFEGTTAYCTATVTSWGKSIDATMVLKQGSTVIDSWSGTGTSVVVLEGEHTVTKGTTYTLEVSGTANGTPFSATKTGKC